MSGYELSRTWFNYCLENPEKVKPNHTALFFWIVENFNRFEWKPKIGLPTGYAMEVLGIRSYNTYISALNDLVDFGFIVMVERSKNQYSSNIIALSKFDKALAKATTEHTTKQSESTIQSTGESIDSIIKPINHIKPINQKTEKVENPRFSPPSLDEVKNLVLEKDYKTVSADSFWNFYESKNWMVGKNKMKDWKKAIAGWEARNKQNSNGNSKSNSNSNSSGPGSGKISGRSSLASGNDHGEFA